MVVRATRLEALRALQAAIEEGVPELEHRVFPWKPRRPGSFPFLEMMPPRWRYYPEQGTTVRLTTDGKLIRDVGRDEVMLELRLTSQDPTFRGKVEADLRNLFLDSPGHPGSLIVQVTTNADTGPFICSWEFDEDVHSESLAQNDEFESALNIIGEVPALAVRRGVKPARTTLRPGGDIASAGARDL